MPFDADRRPVPCLDRRAWVALAVACLLLLGQGLLLRRGRPWGGPRCGARLCCAGHGPCGGRGGQQRPRCLLWPSWLHRRRCRRCMCVRLLPGHSHVLLHLVAERAGPGSHMCWRGHACLRCWQEHWDAQGHHRRLQVGPGQRRSRRSGCQAGWRGSEQLWGLWPKGQQRCVAGSVLVARLAGGCSCWSCPGRLLKPGLRQQLLRGWCYAQAARRRARALLPEGVVHSQHLRRRVAIWRSCHAVPAPRPSRPQAAAQAAARVAQGSSVACSCCSPILALPWPLLLLLLLLCCCPSSSSQGARGEGPRQGDHVRHGVAAAHGHKLRLQRPPERGQRLHLCHEAVQRDGLRRARRCRRRGAVDRGLGCCIRRCLSCWGLLLLLLTGSLANAAGGAGRAAQDAASRGSFG
jgi:hypothetical protein